MHCNLRPPEPRQPFPALNTTLCQVCEPICCRIIAFLLLILYAVTSNFDLEHLHCIACDVMKLRNKFERNRASCGGVNAL